MQCQATANKASHKFPFIKMNVKLLAISLGTPAQLLPNTNTYSANNTKTQCLKTRKPDSDNPLKLNMRIRMGKKEDIKKTWLLIFWDFQTQQS